VLEDPGGAPLDRLLGRSLDVLISCVLQLLSQARCAAFMSKA
jgi:hypothetical protein